MGVQSPPEAAVRVSALPGPPHCVFLCEEWSSPRLRKMFLTFLVSFGVSGFPGHACHV